MLIYLNILLLEIQVIFREKRSKKKILEILKDLKKINFYLLSSYFIFLKKKNIKKVSENRVFFCNL
jgi:hypothetical protein